MSSTHTQRDPATARLVEKHMRNWEIARTQHHDDRPKVKDVQDFIALSRMIGAGGRGVAAAVGQRLGWPVLDREVLQAMAGDDQVRRQLYESMDERDMTWFESAVGGLPSNSFTSNDYFRRLSETILMLARQERTVFLGRAADLILPAHRGLRVRIVAPLEVRLERYRTEHGCTVDEARDAVQRIESDRARFISNHFRVEASDPLRHDVIINSERWTTAAAAELIVQAARLRAATP